MDSAAADVVGVAHHDPPEGVARLHDGVADRALVALDVVVDPVREQQAPVGVVGVRVGPVVGDGQERPAEDVEMLPPGCPGMGRSLGGGILLGAAGRGGLPGGVPGLPRRHGRTGGQVREVPGDVTADVLIGARVVQHRVVTVPARELPGVEHHLLVGVIRMEGGDHTAERVVEHHRADAGPHTELEARGGAEERLVPADRVALVVEHGPAGAHPARIRAGATIDQRTRLGLDLLLDRPAESVTVGEGRLDPAVGTGGQLGDMRLAGQRGDGHGSWVRLVPRPPVCEQVVDQPGRRRPQQGSRVRERVVEEGDDLRLVGVGVEIADRIAGQLAGLAVDRRGDHQPESVERDLAGVAVGVRQPGRRQHPVVVAGRDPVSERVHALDGQQVMVVVADDALGAHLRGVERIPPPTGQEEVAAGMAVFLLGRVRGVGGQERPPGGRPPVAVRVRGGEAAVGLRPRTAHVAATVAVAVVIAVVAGRAAQDGVRIRHQRDAVASEHPRHQPGCKGQLVALAQQRPRLQDAQRQQPGEVVRPVEGAHRLDETASPRADGRPLVGHLVVEAQPHPARPGRIRFAEVRCPEPVLRAGRGVPSQLVAARLGGHRGSMVVRKGGDVVDRVGDGVFAAGEQRDGLPSAISGVRQRRHPPAVRDGRGLQHVAERVDLEGDRVLHPWVVGVALVVAVDRLGRMRQEHRMLPVDAPCLQQLDREAVLGDGVRVLLTHTAVQGVDLLAQHRPGQGAVGLPVLGVRQAAGRRGPRQRAWRQVGGSGRGAGVEPRPREHGWQVGRRVLVVGEAAVRRQDTVARQRTDLLGVPRVHQAEPAELTFLAVEVPVVIGVPGHEAVATDAVVRLDPLDHVHRERQSGDPRHAVAPVLEIELRGRRVGDGGLGAEIVGHPGQEVGLVPAHQVHVAQRSAGVVRQRRGPDQARRPVAQQVGGGDRHHVVHPREDGEVHRPVPAVAALVEVQPDPVPVQVDQVGGAGAVDVRQPDPLLVELVGGVEGPDTVHRHLGAEPAVSEVGPVADLPVADTHEVREPVATEIGEVDGLGTVREDQARARILVERPWHRYRGAESGLGQ